MASDTSETPAAPTAQQTASGAEALINRAQQAVASDSEPLGDSAGIKPFEFQPLDASGEAGRHETLDLIRDVELDVRIELGRTHMYLEDVLKLRSGSVVALDKLAGDPVDILAGGRLIARGEVLVLNENFCVRVNELVTTPAGATR